MATNTNNNDEENPLYTLKAPHKQYPNIIDDNIINQAFSIKNVINLAILQNKSYTNILTKTAELDKSNLQILTDNGFKIKPVHVSSNREINGIVYKTSYEYIVSW